MATVGTWKNSRFNVPLCSPLTFHNAGKPDFESLERCLCIEPRIAVGGDCECFEDGLAPNVLLVTIPPLTVGPQMLCTLCAGTADEAVGQSLCDLFVGTWAIDTRTGAFGLFCEGWNGEGPHAAFVACDPSFVALTVRVRDFGDECAVSLEANLTNIANQVAWAATFAKPVNYSAGLTLPYDAANSVCCAGADPGPVTLTAGAG